MKCISPQIVLDVRSRRIDILPSQILPDAARIGHKVRSATVPSLSGQFASTFAFAALQSLTFAPLRHAERPQGVPRHPTGAPD